MSKSHRRARAGRAAGARAKAEARQASSPSPSAARLSSAPAPGQVDEAQAQAEADAQGSAWRPAEHPAAGLLLDAGFHDTLEQVFGVDPATDPVGDAVRSTEPDPVREPERRDADPAGLERARIGAEGVRRVAAALTGQVAPTCGAPGAPAAGPIPFGQRILPGERLSPWERELIGRAAAAAGAGESHCEPPVDPERLALRADLGEILADTSAWPQPADTAVMPVVADNTVLLARVVETRTSTGPAGLAPAAPLHVEPTPAPARGGGGDQTDDDELLVAPPFAPRTNPVFQAPAIPVPNPPPPAPVPVTPGLLRRIFGVPWETAADLIREEWIWYSAARSASIHHSPSDKGAIAAAVFYAFSRTPLTWDGNRFVGGGAAHDRMHPAVVMYGLALHVRDHRETTGVTP